jgi:hypothetical protein
VILSNQETVYPVTALQFVNWNKVNWDIIKQLIEAGVDVNIRGENGYLVVKVLLTSSQVVAGMKHRS